MSGVSSVPAVVTALLQAVTAAAPPGVGVVDGQPLPNLYGDFIAVGWNDQRPAVTLQESIADMGLSSDRESYLVDSQIVTWDGDTDTASPRARAYTLLSTVAAALQADSRLGGACALARIVQHDYQPAQTDKGSMVTLTFAVQIDAWKS